MLNTNLTVKQIVPLLVKGVMQPLVETGLHLTLQASVVLGRGLRLLAIVSGILAYTGLVALGWLILIAAALASVVGLFALIPLGVWAILALPFSMWLGLRLRRAAAPHVVICGDYFEEETRDELIENC